MADIAKSCQAIILAIFAIHFHGQFFNNLAMKNRITEWRKRRYMTMEKLALAIGTDASTINKLEKGKLRLSDRWLVPLAEALGIAPGDLIGNPVPLDESGKPAMTLPTQRQIPVYGLAAGSLAGQTFLQTEPIEYIAAPHGLATVRDAYALMVKGASMEPRYFSGDLIFIHPHKPVRQGDHVVVQIKGASAMPETWVKRFKADSENEIITEQYNPKAEIRFPRRQLLAMHRVLTVNELLGV